MTNFLTVTLAGAFGALAGASLIDVVPPNAPAYLVSSAEAVTDTSMLRQYGAAVGKTIADFHGNLLVGATMAVALDSSPAPKGRFVIIQFPSMQVLQAWWNSPEYAAIRPLREKSTIGKTFALEGIPTR